MVVVKPEHIADAVWLSHQEFGNSVAVCLLEAFAVYGSGEFSRWDKDRVKSMESTFSEVTGRDKIERNIVGQHILVERLKEKDFFCCDLCEAVLFNYKHALIHFMSSDHIERETAAVADSGIDDIRRVLDSFTKLPQILAKQDEDLERKRQTTAGPFYATMIEHLKPDEEVIDALSELLLRNQTRDPNTGKFRFKLMGEATKTLKKVKGAIGRRSLAELDEHLGEAPTMCMFCHVHTGDRAGFYAHFVSHGHLTRVKERHPGRFEILTMLVNVHRKDLI